MDVLIPTEGHPTCRCAKLDQAVVWNVTAAGLAAGCVPAPSPAGDRREGRDGRSQTGNQEIAMTNDHAAFLLPYTLHFARPFVAHDLSSCAGSTPNTLRPP